MAAAQRLTEGQTVVALKSFRTAELNAHPGDGLPFETVSHNLPALLRGGFVRWALPNEIPTLREPRRRSAAPALTDKPIDLGAPEPPCGDLIVQRNRWVHRIAKANGV